MDFLKLQDKNERYFAYFSMEVGLRQEIATYSGGLGILAGDTIKSFADHHIPTVCITLLNENGYFTQKIDEQGHQQEMPNKWDKEKYMMKLDTQVEVIIEGRTVKISAWEYQVEGVNGYKVPVYFLDTDIEGNSDYDRTLTKQLYGGDNYYRMCQEIVLGIGGAKFIEARGYTNLLRYHMNEGHAAFLTLELMSKYNNDIETVRKKCVFTTHTPVPAGHDKFDKEIVKRALGNMVTEDLFSGNELSMTELALVHSHYVNGVAKRHGEVSQDMFPEYNVDYITNGVHSATWTHHAFAKLFDSKIPSWRQDPYALRYASQLPLFDVWDAHMHAKRELIDIINQRTGADYEYDVFTIGFARRATGYKRMDLLFYNIERLKEIARTKGKIQLVFAGKAHIKDYQGKDLIKKIWDLRLHLGENLKLVFLENYDIELAKNLVSGVDVWLNTPIRPHEASGTSGMKACHNGVPQLSVLDGWWVEGNLEGQTGWSIGGLEPNTDDTKDAADLYFKLEHNILPIFYGDKTKYIEVMRNAIAQNASFFNTGRMVSQYVVNAYLS